MGNVPLTLPNPGGDSGSWGDKLNAALTAISGDYLSQTDGAQIDASNTFVPDQAVNPGRLAVGKATPVYRLDVADTTTATTGATNFGGQLLYTASPADASGVTGSYYALNVTTSYAAANSDTTGSVGGLRVVGVTGPKRANTCIGVDAYAQSTSADTATLTTSLYAGRFKAQNHGAGHIEHAIGWKVNTGENTAGGTVDVFFGGYIADQTGIAGAADTTALHIEGAGTGNALSFAGDGTSARNARIYSPSAGIIVTDGKLGVGKATAVYRLDVADTFTATTGSNAAVSVFAHMTPTAASTGVVHGIEATADYDAAVDSPAAIVAGLWTRGFAATNKLNTLAGVDAVATYAGTDTTAATAMVLAALRAQAQNSSTGRVTYGMGLKVLTPTNAGTMDVAFGAYIGRQDNAGATDSAALHIEGSGAGNAISFGVNSAARATRLYSPAAGQLVSDGAFTTQATTTANRPSATTLGAGAQIYDQTLSQPIWSDGSGWRDASGAAV